MRSIIPAEPLALDLGDGEKIYSLRRTNFSSVVLAGLMQRPDFADALAALAGADQQEGDPGEVLGETFTALLIDQQVRLIAAQLFALLQYDHPEIQYRDVLSMIPMEPAEIARIAKATMAAWERGAPPEAPKIVDEDEPEQDPTKGQSGGKEKPARKRSRSSN